MVRNKFPQRHSARRVRLLEQMGECRQENHYRKQHQIVCTPIGSLSMTVLVTTSGKNTVETTKLGSWISIVGRVLGVHRLEVCVDGWI